MTNDSSQDGREQHGRSKPAALLDSNTLVYVEYTPNGFQWGKTTGSMVPLATDIDTVSSSSITYEFVRTGSTSIWYKLPPSTPNGSVLHISDGPTAVVMPTRHADISFSTSSGGTYYTGSVTVSGDGFRRDLAAGGAHEDDEDEDEDEDQGG